jgi:hypothetical protein
VKCRHNAYASAYIDGAWHARYRALDGRRIDRLVCIDCRAWLSIGPSNDAGCEVEIRAAQIIADDYMLWQEAMGFECDDDAEPSGNREHHPSWHAGYLARCIATHEDER